MYSAKHKRFKIKSALVGVTAVNGLFIYAIIQQVILNKPFGTKPAPDFVLVLIELFFIAAAFCIVLTFKTRIMMTALHIGFYPFQLKNHFLFSKELSDAYMREYSALYEYGG